MSEPAHKLTPTEAHDTSALTQLEKPWHIEGKFYDTFLIVCSPLLSFLIVLIFCAPRPDGQSFLIPVHTPKWLLFAASTMVFTHIMLVYARSHLNKNVFSRFPYRFTLVPLFLMTAMYSSSWLLGVMLWISVEWDEIHTVMQTFGFGRIYDSKIGNDPNKGRKLDMGLCFVLEYLPHIILLTMLPLHDLFQEMEWKITTTMTTVAIVVNSLTFPLVMLAAVYLLYYSYKYHGLVRGGYKISKAKITLYALTGITNILVVWKYTVVEAALMGNIYHALQYFAIVWVSERNNLGQVFKTNKLKFGKAFLFVGLFGTLIALALTRQFTTDSVTVLAAFWTTTSLMHFWYDGFIWSVRKKDI